MTACFFFTICTVELTDELINRFIDRLGGGSDTRVDEFAHGRLSFSQNVVGNQPSCL